MTDTSTKKPIRVSTNGNAGPYIMVAAAQVNDVRSLLDAHGLRYWVDEYAISINGKPAMTVVNLGRTVDAKAVQRILNKAP